MILGTEPGLSKRGVVLIEKVPRRLDTSTGIKNQDAGLEHAQPGILAGRVDERS